MEGVAENLRGENDMLKVKEKFYEGEDTSYIS